MERGEAARVGRCDGQCPCTRHCHPVPLRASESRSVHKLFTTDAASGVGVAPHPQRPPPTLWELRYAEALDKPNGRHVKGLTRYLEFGARAVASFSWYTGEVDLGYGSKRRREADQARMLKSYKAARPRL